MVVVQGRGAQPIVSQVQVPRRAIASALASAFGWCMVISASGLIAFAFAVWGKDQLADLILHRLWGPYALIAAGLALVLLNRDRGSPSPDSGGAKSLDANEGDRPG